MNVNTKINMKAQAYLYLTSAQYMQLIKRNLIALTPYYAARLKIQGEAVREADSYKKVFGKYRFELENS